MDHQVMLTMVQNIQILQRHAETAFVLANMTERQKTYARHAERLSRVEEMLHCVAKCHLLLNETIEQMETLNNMLPADL